MAFLSFYTLKGFSMKYLLNLSYDEKLFMIATMDLEIERMNKSLWYLFFFLNKKIVDFLRKNNYN